VNTTKLIKPQLTMTTLHRQRYRLLVDLRRQSFHHAVVHGQAYGRTLVELALRGQRRMVWMRLTVDQNPIYVATS
jgi:hypothetical protein